MLWSTRSIRSSASAASFALGRLLAALEPYPNPSNGKKRANLLHFARYRAV